MQGRIAFSLSGGAFVWCVAVILAAITYPAYQGMSSSSGAYTRTIVEVNGYGSLFAVALPAVACVFIFLALKRVCTSGSPRARTTAQIIAGLMAVYSLLAGFSFGIAVMPAALAVLAAVAITPDPPAR